MRSIASVSCAQPSRTVVLSAFLIVTDHRLAFLSFAANHIFEAGNVNAKLWEQEKCLTFSGCR